jgi:hypothetical protein
MGYYTKKPVMVEAKQWNGDNVGEMFTFFMGGFREIEVVEGKDILLIHTLEGTMMASLGDYIIKGVEGEFYPCKEDIFHKTYEKVREVK